MKAVYEDIRTVPTNRLFRKLDKVEYVFPRFSSIVEENDDLKRDDLVEKLQLFSKLQNRSVGEDECIDEETLQDKLTDWESALNETRSFTSKEPSSRSTLV